MPDCVPPKCGTASTFKTACLVVDAVPHFGGTQSGMQLHLHLTGHALPPAAPTSVAIDSVADALALFNQGFVSVLNSFK